MFTISINYLSTPTQKNQWTRELQNVRQKESEGVEDYAHRFRRILRRATQDQVLADRYQVNYFINSLLPIFVSQVVIANPDTLNAAIK